jgi:hypothetical protein
LNFVSRRRRRRRNRKLAGKIPRSDCAHRQDDKPNHPHRALHKGHLMAENVNLVSLFAHIINQPVDLRDQFADFVNDKANIRRRIKVLRAGGFAASRATSRDKCSSPPCRPRRIAISISSRGAPACRCARLLCDRLAAGHRTFLPQVEGMPVVAMSGFTGAH